MQVQREPAANTAIRILPRILLLSAPGFLKSKGDFRTSNLISSTRIVLTLIINTRTVHHHRATLKDHRRCGKPVQRAGTRVSRNSESRRLRFRNSSIFSRAKRNVNSSPAASPVIIARCAVPAGSNVAWAPCPCNFETTVD